MFQLDDISANRVADLIVRKLEKKFMRMPDEFKRMAYAPYATAAVTIPVKPGSDPDNEINAHMSLSIYITDSGGMVLRIQDAWGRQIAEKSFL